MQKISKQQIYVVRQVTRKGFILSLLLFLIWTFLVLNIPRLTLVNHEVNHFWQNIQTLPLSYLAIFLSFLGDKQIIIPALLLASIMLALRGQMRLASHLAGVIILAALLAYGLKNLIAFPRPSIFNLPHKFAYPSRHVTLCTTYVVFFASLILPRLKQYRGFTLIGCMIFVILESISRLILGVHWITDVVGGFFLGSFCGFLGAYSYYAKEPTSENFSFLFKSVLVIFVVLASFYGYFCWEQLLNNYAL